MAVTPLDMRVRALLERFVDYVRNEGDNAGWTVRCPVHHPDDEVWAVVGDDGVLQPCALKCAPGDMLAACEPIMRTRVPGEDDGDGEANAAAVFAIPVAELLVEKIPPAAWIVPGYVQEHSITILAGPPGAGKTLLAFDWSAQRAAAGKRVFVAQNEGGKRALQDRLARACAAAGLNPPPSTFTYRRNLELSLSDLKSVRAFAKNLIGYDLIILDSLASFWPGLNENDPEQMSVVAEALKIICETTGAAVIGIHHTTKAAWKPDEKPSLADIRGHGTLGGRIDAAFICKPMERQEGLVRFELYVVKQRDEDWAPPREMEIVMTGTAATMTTREQEPGAARMPGRKPRHSFEEIKREIVRYVRNTRPLPSGNQAACDVGGTKTVALDAIDELIADGVLVRIGTGKNCKLAVRIAGSESEDNPNQRPATDRFGSATPKGVGWPRTDTGSVLDAAGSNRTDEPKGEA